MESPSAKPYVGGQAVIEGVMMRSPRSMAVAVRRPDGSIVVREDAWISLFERVPFLRWPFFRGALVLIESLWNGLSALNFSAHQAEMDEAAITKEREAHESQPKVQTASGEPVGRPAAAPDPKSKAAMAGTMAFSFLIAMGLFVGLPHMLAWGAGRLAGDDVGLDSFLFHALDGMFKIGIFVGYIAGISMIPEIRRVFQYHGAEHKAINVYEHAQDLTVENARGWTTFHARCGTSFVLFVLTLSIFMFAAIFPFIPAVSELALLNHLAMIGIKVPLMIPLAGIAYEVNRYASRHPDQWWVQILVGPGRLMQKLTTREPDDDQLEIALAAMRAALAAEARLASREVQELRAIAKAEAEAGGRVTVFRDFGEAESGLAISS